MRHCICGCEADGRRAKASKPPTVIPRYPTQVHYLARTGVEGDRLRWTPAKTGDQTRDKLIASVMREGVNKTTHVSYVKRAWSQGFKFEYSKQSIYTIRYDTIRDAILTRARKPTWVGLIYRTEATTKNYKTEKLKSKKQPMLGVTVKVWGIMQSVLKKKKKGSSGKDLQKKRF